MNQLYASIKKSSEYYHQTLPGQIFPVIIRTERNNYYRVKGGPGGQYALSDVNLYVVDGDSKVRIS